MTMALSRRALSFPHVLNATCTFSRTVPSSSSNVSTLAIRCEGMSRLKRLSESSAWDEGIVTLGLSVLIVPAYDCGMLLVVWDVRLLVQREEVGESMESCVTLSVRPPSPSHGHPPPTALSSSSQQQQQDIRTDRIVHPAMTSSSSSSFQILEAPYDSPLFELVKQIRVAVFVDEQGYAASDEFDGYDDGCVHLLLVEDDGNGTQTPAGTLRYFPPSDTTKSEKMGRLAVAKQYRGKGLASKLLKELERMLVEGDLEACRGKKVTEIQCNAQGERVAARPGPQACPASGRISVRAERSRAFLPSRSASRAILQGFGLHHGRRRVPVGLLLLQPDLPRLRALTLFAGQCREDGTPHILMRKKITMTAA